MKNNSEQNKKIKPEKITIRINETIGIKLAETILVDDLEIDNLPPLSSINQIDLLLTIDHKPESEGGSDA